LLKPLDIKAFTLFPLFSSNHPKRPKTSRNVPFR
jgi:hypothetical protein